MSTIGSVGVNFWMKHVGKCRYQAQSDFISVYSTCHDTVCLTYPGAVLACENWYSTPTNLSPPDMRPKCVPPRFLPIQARHHGRNIYPISTPEKVQSVRCLPPRALTRDTWSLVMTEAKQSIVNHISDCCQVQAGDHQWQNCVIKPEQTRQKPHSVVPQLEQISGKRWLRNGWNNPAFRRKANEL